MRRDPEKLRAWKRRSKGLNRQGARKLRTLADERAFRVDVKARAGGMCEAHTPACPTHRHEGHHAHHRAIADRRRGVHDPARGLFCCQSAHLYIHAHPQESYDRGWLLRSDGAR